MIIRPYSCHLMSGCEKLLSFAVSERVPLTDESITHANYCAISQHHRDRAYWRIGPKAVRQLHASRIRKATAETPKEEILPLKLMGWAVNP